MTTFAIIAIGTACLARTWQAEYGSVQESVWALATCLCAAALMVAS